MIGGFLRNEKAVSPVIAIVLLLMMTVAAAGAAYFWITSMQSRMQKASYKSIEKVMESTGRRVVAQATLCKPTYPYEGLKGYWMMEKTDGTNGTAVLDSSGNENNGTLYLNSTTQGATANGQVGQALEFDGGDDYVDIPPYSTFSQFTISYWSKHRSTSGGDWDPDLCILNNNRIYVRGTGDGYVKLSMQTSESWFAKSVPIEENVWNFWTWTWDGSTVKAYKNGVEKWSEPLGGSMVEHNEQDTIGSEGTDYFLDGILDEIRIYDRALSQSAIEALYEAGRHGGRREVDITVRNIGSEEIPKATWVANLKQDGTTIETDAYNASSIGTGELKTLKFYFKNFKPNTEYTIELQGTGTSTTVSC